MINHNTAQKPPNPFNSGSPVDPNDFVGRVEELENFRQKLRQTISGSLANMAVAGGYGVGKTSFLHKCKSIAEEQNALSIYFSLNEFGNLDRENLATLLVQRIQEKVREEIILRRISSSIWGVLKKIKIKTEQGLEISVSDPIDKSFPNLHTAIEHAWNELKNSKSSIVFLMDEARVLEKNRADLILYLRAVLEQLQISHTPVMIVPAGKLTISGPSGTGFSPLVRTFPPVILENFTENECRVFANKKLEQIGFKITSDALKKVYKITEGHPYVLVAYLATAYSKVKAGENELNDKHFGAADIEFVDRTLAPFFSRFFDQAGKNNRNILLKISINNGSMTLSDLSESLGKDNNELSPHIGKLVQDGAIIRIERGRYKLFHHLLGDYIKNRNKV